MKHLRLVVVALAASILGTGTAPAADINAQRGIVDFLAPVLPDPVMQHSKEVFVSYGCAYCHGVDLRVRNGEAADLYASALVGFDRNGELIGPLIRKGVAATERVSPMPQFSDLSEQEVAAIVRWIHFARQQRKVDELKKVQIGRGDGQAGKDYFAANCASCHAAGVDFAALRRQKDQRLLADRMLRPAFVDQQPKSMSTTVQVDPKRVAARAEHLSLLERYTASDLDNLAAYLASWP